MEQSRMDGLSPEERARAAAFEKTVIDGIAQARQEGRPIDHLTAKRIAQDLEPGSGPLHDFAETGALPEDFETELRLAAEVVQGLELPERLLWIAALGDYTTARLIRSALPGWGELGAE